MLIIANYVVGFFDNSNISGTYIVGFLCQSTNRLNSARCPTMCYFAHPISDDTKVVGWNFWYVQLKFTFGSWISDGTQPKR